MLMGNVKFYLKDEKTKDKTPIYLLFQYKGNKLKYYFGESIEPKNWTSQKKYRVKSNKATTADGKLYLNDLLDNLEKECIAAYNKEIKNGTPLPATIKKYLDAFVDQQRNRDKEKKAGPTLYSVIDNFVSGHYKKHGEIDKSPRTLQNYHAVKLHLQAFEKAKGYRIDFETITRDFFKEYTKYLRTILKLHRNTIAKDITFLKVFMNKAVSEGYTTNLDYKHKDFYYKEEETDAVYLRESEIEHLFEFDAGSKKLNNAKDLFVAGSWLGLRYSDLKKQLNKPDIIVEDGERYIRSKNQKTGRWVYIPLHPMVIKVMDRYKGNANSLPTAISSQKLNEYIKEVCKKAELNQKGRLETDPAKPLYDCVSSHTMRRSMASNFYLLGIAPEDLMPITGHTTRKSFDKYIKVSRLDKAKKLNTKIKELWHKAHINLKAV